MVHGAESNCSLRKSRASLNVGCRSFSGTDEHGRQDPLLVAATGAQLSGHDSIDDVRFVRSSEPLIEPIVIVR